MLCLLGISGLVAFPACEHISVNASFPNLASKCPGCQVISRHRGQASCSLVLDVVLF